MTSDDWVGLTASLPDAVREVLAPGAPVVVTGCAGFIGSAVTEALLALGCRVTGVDITAEFCRAASMLANRTGMDEKVTFERADAIELPFEGGSFDLVWMQHMAMNIKDKRRLFSEVRRVLKPGRNVAFHEPMLGDGAVLDMRYPVPWDRNGRVSFLISPDEMRVLLEKAGFEPLVWEDVTDEARQWFERVVKRMGQEGPPVLGLHVLLGPEMMVMSSNMLKNIVDGRLRLIRAVLRGPSPSCGGGES